MNIRPLHDRLVVRRLEEETTSAGGIVLPDSATEKPSQGEVLAIGPGKTLDNGERSSFNVSKGDRVLFTSYAGTDVKYEGEEYIIMREDDILGKVK